MHISPPLVANRFQLSGSMHKFLEAANIIASFVSLFLTVYKGISGRKRRGKKVRCGKYRHTLLAKRVPAPPVTLSKKPARGDTWFGYVQEPV
jgi:hypothetical protein